MTRYMCVLFSGARFLNFGKGCFKKLTIFCKTFRPKNHFVFDIIVQLTFCGVYAERVGNVHAAFRVNNSGVKSDYVFSLL